jgi:hypothetical protein
MRSAVATTLGARCHSGRHGSPIAGAGDLHGNSPPSPTIVPPERVRRPDEPAVTGWPPTDDLVLGPDPERSWSAVDLSTPAI